MDKVHEILAKESWNESDVNTLISYKEHLPESAKIKLGLVPSPSIVEAVKEPVIEVQPVSGVAKAAQKIKDEQEKQVEEEKVKKPRKSAKK